MNRAGQRGSELRQAVEPSAVVVLDLRGHRASDFICGHDGKLTLGR